MPRLSLYADDIWLYASLKPGDISSGRLDDSFVTVTQTATEFRYDKSNLM